MIDAMKRRAGKVRQRAAVRRWEYRQRHYSHGVWFRLRCVLADAQEAFLLDRSDGDRLTAAGFTSEPVGDELEPPRRLVFATREAILELPSARRVAVRLSSDVLSANCVAAGAGFVAERQPSSAALELRHQFRDGLGRVHDLAHIPQLTGRVGDRHGNRFLMHIQAHVLAKLVHDLPPQCGSEPRCNLPQA